MLRPPVAHPTEVQTVRRARFERDQLAHKIAGLIMEFEAISGMRVEAVRLRRNDNKDHCGVKRSRLQVALAVDIGESALDPIKELARGAGA